MKTLKSETGVNSRITSSVKFWKTTNIAGKRNLDQQRKKRLYAVRTENYHYTEDGHIIVYKFYSFPSDKRNC